MIVIPHFLQRAPSQSWEQIPISWIPGCYVWGWFKPAQSPTDVILRIPEELFAVLAPQLTMRGVISLAGLTPQEVHFWSLNGMHFESHGGMNPLLDQLLPPPVNWADSGITIRALVPGMQPYFSATAMPQQSMGMQFSTGPVNQKTTAMTPDAERALASMAADWDAIQVMETQLTQLRKQLNSAQGRLQSLNRDLSSDERSAADSNDVKNWQDARRFLRDAAGHTSRYIREFDVGSTSTAGVRSRFEEIYKKYVAPKVAFEGITTTQHEFEAYRKSVQSLLAKMQTALSNAGSNGEQKAQQVLSRIGAKMRKSRNRE
ncbi:hypothetical protein SH668x_000764 [Planctomicrobium sp. SH668]|uniref:hypothetical protein n=1 Tax=Planctomicrobium sp. SH668 TaxID=3448126 RepID=UPI003F5C68A0